jgi:hypothetical protein
MAETDAVRREMPREFEALPLPVVDYLGTKLETYYSIRRNGRDSVQREQDTYNKQQGRPDQWGQQQYDNMMQELNNGQQRNEDWQKIQEALHSSERAQLIASGEQDTWNFKYKYD